MTKVQRGFGRAELFYSYLSIVIPEGNLRFARVAKTQSGGELFQ
jgi:hypothetical protein